jgi:Uma2 family endonuclease
MLMATKTRRWTSADLVDLPDDGNRYEVLDGELFVTPQAVPDHQIGAFALARKLADYCDAHGIGHIATPGAVIWTDNELQPDVQVIPGKLVLGGKTAWKDLPLPLLVVEVLSPSTWRRDRHKKRDAYMRLNIPTYWIVDIDEQSVTVWRTGSLEPETVTDVLQWSPKADVPPFELSLASIFGPA